MSFDWKRVPVPHRLGETLLTAEQIQDRVRALAQQISQDYQGQELILISILKGSYMFLADLSRALTLPVRVDFLGLSSYRGTESSGQPEWTARLTTSLRNRHVLVVEDIVDSGRTLTWICDHLTEHHPASLRTCVLLDKPERRCVPFVPDYVGFVIPDRFVVGYGLDYDGWFRQLPYIAVLKSPEDFPPDDS